MSVTDTSPQGGTDSAQPSTDLDNPANWDYYDPDEEQQDTAVAPTHKGTEGEKAENAEGIQEAATDSEEEAQEPEAQAEGDEEATKEITDDILVPMPEGDALPLAELKKGYLRQSDYSRKTQDLSQRVEWVDTRAAYITNVAQAAQQFLQETMPQRPDPMLAQQNPGLYLAQERFFNDWQMRFSKAQELVNESGGLRGELQGEMSEQQKAELISSEQPKLMAALPHLKDQKAKAEFYGKATEVLERAGFENAGEVFNGILDHRQAVILHWAAQGLAADNAKKSALAKVAKAPPAQPQKRGQGNASTAIKNLDAMKKLSRSGSIQDAMNVDFD